MNNAVSHHSLRGNLKYQCDYNFTYLKYNENSVIFFFEEMKDTSRKQINDLTVTIKQIEKHKLELLDGFKKQMQLIDNLKKQKVGHHSMAISYN